MAEPIEATIINFKDLPLALEAHRSSTSPDETVKDAVKSFELTEKQLAVLPAQ
ncbi:MAG TPA: hypothetical protein VGF48_26875 [Thermoanaerobaculia bacterium]|jgi:hypothetical protein